MREIIPGKRLVVDVDETPQRLPIEKPVILYIRRSTEGQKGNLASLIQQDTRMERRLVAKGYTNVIKIDIDDGISGQKTQEDRLGLKQTYSMLRRGEAGTLAAFDVSRIWRDRTHVYFNSFIAELKKLGVPIIVNDRTFWPNVEADEKALRHAFEEAQAQLDQFYKKANPARMVAIEENYSFGGHAVPMGYVVTGTKADKHYLIYEPHAKLVRWLYQRYRELGGNLGRLRRELERLDFHFPHFDEKEIARLGASIPHVALNRGKTDNKGYPLVYRNAIISILTNPAYLGWYLYNGMVVSKEAHKPIVSYDLFMYAYTKLNDRTLEGEPNESRPKVERHTVDVPALLEGLLTSNGIPVYVMSRGTYAARLPVDKWKSTELIIRVEKLDSIIDAAMLHALSIMGTRKRLGVQSDVDEQVEALLVEKTEQLVDYDEQLATIDTGINEWELAKRVSMREQDEPGVTEAVRNLKRLRSDRATVEEAREQAGKEAALLSESTELINEALVRYTTMTIEQRRRLIRLFVSCADIVEETPHILKLTLHFTRIPLQPTPMVVFFYRTSGSRPAWTEAENEILRTMYTHADRADIMEALPVRTWESASLQARALGLSRTWRRDPADIPENMTHADIDLMCQLDWPDRDVPRMLYELDGNRQANWQIAPEDTLVKASLLYHFSYYSW